MFFLLKKTFFTDKNINENVKTYIYHLRNIFLCRKCLCYKEKFLVESRFWKTIGCSYVTLFTTYSQKNNVQS